MRPINHRNPNANLLLTLKILLSSNSALFSGKQRQSVAERLATSRIADGLPTGDRWRFPASGQGRDRTADTWIFSPVLYQLSYLSTFSNWCTIPYPCTSYQPTDFHINRGKAVMSQVYFFAFNVLQQLFRPLGSFAPIESDAMQKIVPRNDAEANTNQPISRLKLSPLSYLKILKPATRSA